MLIEYFVIANSIAMIVTTIKYGGTDIVQPYDVIEDITWIYLCSIVVQLVVQIVVIEVLLLLL